MSNQPKNLKESFDYFKTDKVHNSQRERLRFLLIAFISYQVDAVFLTIYFFEGIIPLWVPIAYSLVAFLVNLPIFLMIRFGWNRKLKDPHLAIPQSLLGNMVQFSFLFLAPQVGFIFLLLMFIVSSFETLALTFRQFLAMWFLVAVSTGLIIIQVGDKMSLPIQTPAQQITTWLVFVSILARVIFVNMQISDLRKALGKQNQKLKTSLRQIEELANTDPLTNILNRRAFIKCAEEELKRSRRNRSEFCIVIFDLDHFKVINDTFGHQVGDEVLVKTAQIVSQTIRQTDKLGRYGGEEFILLFPETPIPGCQIIMDRIYQKIAAYDWKSIADGLKIQMSTGIASFKAEENLKDLTCRADRALYEAKNAGRNRMRIG
ncbi:MAG: GGDEF domain-containing protein [Pyrinomonadaceae bacterium]